MGTAGIYRKSWVDGRIPHEEEEEAKVQVTLQLFLPFPQAPASSLAVWSKPGLCHSLAQGSWARDFPTPNLNFLRKMGRDSGVWIPEMTL